LPVPSRGNAHSWILNRWLANALVVGLLAATATVGLVSANGLPAGGPGLPAPDRHPIGFDFVGTVDAAAGTTASTASLRSVSLALEPDPGASDPLMVLRMPDPTPVPTPKPVLAAPRPVVRSYVAPVAPPPVSSGELLWPVPGGVITQYYHAGHLALDIATSAGSPAIAAHGGIVTWAGWKSNGGGNVIVIDRGDGLQTGYNHLGSLWVSVGQSVGAGQAIGGVGCTGLCTGPHVHFQVIVGGVAVNPLRYL